jgi:aminoglycoside phosphotransferase (APT) family kinase protein
VLSYDTTFKNPLGDPYIMIDRLPGEVAHEMWKEKESDEPSAETEARRHKFLVSLARAMVNLQKLEFPSIGETSHNPGDLYLARVSRRIGREAERPLFPYVHSEV